MCCGVSFWSVRNSPLAHWVTDCSPFGAFGGDFSGSLGIPHWVRSIAQAPAGSHPSPLVQGVRAMFLSGALTSCQAKCCAVGEEKRGPAVCHLGLRPGAVRIPALHASAPSSRAACLLQQQTCRRSGARLDHHAGEVSKRLPPSGAGAPSGAMQLTLPLCPSMQR